MCEVSAKTYWTHNQLSWKKTQFIENNRALPKCFYKILHYLINQIIIKLVHKKQCYINHVNHASHLKARLINYRPISGWKHGKTNPLGRENNNNKNIHTVKSGNFGLPGDFGQALVYWKKALIKQEVCTLHLPFWTFY